MTKRMLYFSYGSNMSIARLQARVPSAQFVTTATLCGHVLKFHKHGKDGSAKCDAYQTGSPDHAMLGVVFEIEKSEKAVLDQKEGLGNGYEEKEVILTTKTGETLRAATYYATHINPTLKPYQWYKHHVLTGAQQNGLPEFYLQQINTIEAITDPDPERHEYEMAIYASK
jgi:gamma-glutamylcyclotransferase